MSSLFIVMLGGRHARANTEVHDVVLAVGDSLEEVYPQLKNAWFGEPQGLHIDAWHQLHGVEFENKKYYVDKLNILYSDEISYFLRECIENNDSFRFDIFNSNGFKS